MAIDILGVSNEDVWSYGEALREMAREKKLVNVKFLWLTDLLDGEVAHDTQITTINNLGHNTTFEEDRVSYLPHASCKREKLVARFKLAGFDAEKAIKEDRDTSLTYLSYVKFLKKDLEHVQKLKFGEDGKLLSATQYIKVIRGIAKAMLTRGAAFAAAINLLRQHMATTFAFPYTPPPRSRSFQYN